MIDEPETEPPTPPPIPAARLVFSAADRAAVTARIDESLRSGRLTLGPITTELETAFGSRHGVRRAVATASGTSALEIIVRSLGVEGGEVVVPTNTFFATGAAVIHAGGSVRLADVEAATFALSAAALDAAIGPRTVGAIVVHIGGMITPEIDDIRRLCDERGIWLVEDAAHAHGADFAGRAAGSFGHAAAFSFYPTKVMTSAEGGMIVTDDDQLADEALVYRDQGKASFLGGDHVRLGYAWRMSEVHAAVGVVQLARLDEFVAQRRRIASRFHRELGSIDGIEPVVPPDGVNSNYYKYLALLAPGVDRNWFKKRLQEDHGVSCTGEVYATPLHRQPVFADVPTTGPLTVAEDLCARQVCLPVHSDMTEPEADRVIQAVADTLSRNGGR